MLLCIFQFPHLLDDFHRVLPLINGFLASPGSVILFLPLIYSIIVFSDPYLSREKTAPSRTDYSKIIASSPDDLNSPGDLCSTCIKQLPRRHQRRGKKNKKLYSNRRSHFPVNSIQNSPLIGFSVILQHWIASPAIVPMSKTICGINHI